MADALYDAMKGAGTKERVLNEIIAGCSKDDVDNLKKAYEAGRFCHNWEERGVWLAIGTSL